MGDWSRLLHDLLVLIARKLPMLEDFAAFRGVCTSWRAAASKDEFNKWPTLPFLMLSENHDSEMEDEAGDGNREFYSLYKGNAWMKLSLPELKGKRCIEARFGWPVTIEASGELALFHPFSREQIVLPSQSTFAEYEFYLEELIDAQVFFVGRAVLSANPSETFDFVLMVIPCSIMNLGFWRSGDKSWTTSEKISGICDVNYYNGRFYGVTWSAHIWVWDVCAPDLSAAPSLLFRVDSKSLLCRGGLYLVESCGGELLIVGRDGMDDDGHGDYGASNFVLIQLDLINGQWKEIRSLGDNAVFLGNNAAFSLQASSFPNVVMPNCIYFTDDCVGTYYSTEAGGGKDTGIYNLEDGKIKRFDGVQSFSLICPVWVAPNVFFSY